MSSKSHVQFVEKIAYKSGHIHIFPSWPDFMHICNHKFNNDVGFGLGVNQKFSFVESDLDIKSTV